MEGASMFVYAVNFPSGGNHCPFVNPICSHRIIVSLALTGTYNADCQNCSTHKPASARSPINAFKVWWLRGMSRGRLSLMPLLRQKTAVMRAPTQRYGAWVTGGKKRYLSDMQIWTYAR